MKSVCFVVQNVYDIDPRVRRKAEALVAAGYSVDVLALRGPSGKKSYSIDGVNVRTMSLGKKRGSQFRYFFEYSTFFLWVALRVPLQMLRRKYAVIDVNTLPDFLIFAPFLARWMGAKLILDMHEITPEFYMSKYHVAAESKIIRFMTYLERISFNFADYVLTVNDPIEDLLVNRGLARAKSIVVMNAADEGRFTAHMNSDSVPDDGNRKFVMMYHGTLTPIYGLDIAVEAFALAHREMPGAELWILGRGGEEERLAKLLRERELTVKVKLVGQVKPEEIPAWLSQCDAGVLPLRRDVFLDFAFPNKLGEFIIMGKPVIVSRLKAIQYYFSEDALAFFEPESPADLAREMIGLYQNSQLGVQKATKAKQEYAPIRWDLMRSRYVELIGSVVSTVDNRGAAVHRAAAE